jgi:hypothetical protein
MSLPTRRGPSARWDVIRYALGSNARTFRLCLILLVASIAPVVGLLELTLRVRW